MVVFNGGLYVGTRNEASGGEVWRYDGSGWTRANLLGGFGDRNNVEVSSLAVYGTYIYAGTENNAGSGGSGCQVWRYTGLLWTQVNGSGFGNVNNLRVPSMTTGNGKLYTGTQNTGYGSGRAWGTDSVGCPW